VKLKIRKFANTVGSRLNVKFWVVVRDFRPPPASPDLLRGQRATVQDSMLYTSAEQAAE
jgi:hypothetical protein